MLVYCKRCEAANHEDAEVCSQCGRLLAESRSPIVKVVATPLPLQRYSARPRVRKAVGIGAVGIAIVGIWLTVRMSETVATVPADGKAPVAALRAPLAPAVGPGSQAQGVGWSAKRVMALLPESDGWEWSQTSNAPGIEYQARMPGSVTPNVKIVGPKGNLLSVTFMTAVQKEDDVLADNSKVHEWAERTCEIPSIIAGADATQCRYFFVSAFDGLIKQIIADPRQSTFLETRNSGRCDFVVGFAVIKAGGFVASISVSRHLPGTYLPLVDPKLYVRIESRITERNESWHRHAWKLTAFSGALHDIVFDADIRFVDESGFIIAEESEYELSAVGRKETVFSGFSLIDPEVSRNVNGVMVVCRD